MKCETIIPSIGKKEVVFLIQEKMCRLTCRLTQNKYKKKIFKRI